MKQPALWSGVETPQLSLRVTLFAGKVLPSVFELFQCAAGGLPGTWTRSERRPILRHAERLARGPQDETFGLLTDRVILHVITPARPPDLRHGTADPELAAKFRFGNAGPSPAQSEFGAQRFLMFSPF
jgi:hypothetical protein